jgi:hypothetical protein
MLWLAVIVVLARTAQAASIDESAAYGPGVFDALNSVISARGKLERWEIKARCSEIRFSSDHLVVVHEGQWFHLGYELLRQVGVNQSRDAG